MIPGYDEPLDEWRSMEPQPGVVAGCVLAFVVGWCLLCGFMTGMAIASYG